MSEELRVAIHRYFNETGHEVCDAIYRELLKPGGLPKLLKRLAVSVPTDSNGQYLELLTYFRHKGTKEFEQLAGLRPLEIRIELQSSANVDTRSMKDKPTSDSQPVTKPASPPAHPTPIPHTVPYSPPRSGLEIPGSLTELRESKVVQKPTVVEIPGLAAQHVVNRQSHEAVRRQDLSPADTGPSRTGPSDTSSGTRDYSTSTAGGQMGGARPVTPGTEDMPRGPLRPGIPPAEGTFDAKTPSYDPNKPNDPNGSWPQCERRSGRERRRLVRRSNVDIVYSNKRYGKDRRSQVERRRNWPKDGHRP